MSHSTFNNYTQSYLNDLEYISSIKFTHREIDIIACVLNGRSVKKIGDFLGISPKTIETHMRNIMIKLECNSRESIIDFLEGSAKIQLVRQHYQNLLIQFKCEKILLKIAPLMDTENVPDLILCGQSEEATSFLISKLQHYLTMAGIKNTLEKIEKHSPLIENDDLKSYKILNILQTNGDKKVPLNKLKEKMLCLILEGESIPKRLQPNEYVDFRNLHMFYNTFFELLEKLKLSDPINEIITEFQNSKAIGDVDSTAVHKTLKKEEPIVQKNKFLIFKEKKYIFSIVILCLIALGVWFLSLRVHHEDKIQEAPSIRSDLLIPAKSGLLKRPHLIAQITKKLNEQQGIQTVALVGIVGMGGVGKTTLARHFGRLQKSAIIWEINAETTETLLNSFHDLAYALAQNQEEKEEIELMQKIENPAEREKQILSFVKKQLQTHPNWFLIYDNVEEFSDITKYFPHDPQVWGAGKVLITTKDSNIKNNSYINPDHIIEIGELGQEEALGLFCKILYGCNPEKLPQDQVKKALNLLKSIPPFPLDVSVAGYYIRDTGITYEKYLERIDKYSKNFHVTQETLLKEVSNYAKTRYGIITLSFKKLMEVNPEYKKLLLLICLLDSQHIPKTLLEIYKNPVIAEQFLHDLRKYSLITSDTLKRTKDPIHTFSLHRSTQFLGKNFLLSISSVEERENLIKGTINSLESFQKSYFYGSFSDKNSMDIAIFLPHLEAFLKNLNTISIHPNLKDKYEKQLLLILGYGYLNDIKNYRMAVKYLTQVYQLECKHRSLPIHTLAVLLKDLSEIASMLEDPDKAIVYAQESLKILSKVPGSEIRQIENLKNIGTAYMHKNNFEEAKNYLNLALSKLPNPDNELKKELKSEIYSQLSWLYSATYIHQNKTAEGIVYALKSLEILNATALLQKMSQPPAKKLSCLVCKQKVNLGIVYLRVGKYPEAMEQGFSEAQYILDNHLDNCKHVFAKLKLSLGVGHLLLRQGKLKDAYKKLTEAIVMSEKLIGPNNTYIPLPARSMRAETNIRLGNLREAYEDCKAVFAISANSHTNRSDLVRIRCYYHAAVIQDSLGDLQQSLKYFAEFFAQMKVLSQKLLEPKIYEALQAKGVFTVPAYTQKRAKESIKICLKNSVEIYMAIYGGAHPFVKDYIFPNYEGLKRSWF